MIAEYQNLAQSLSLSDISIRIFSETAFCDGGFLICQLNL